ncbi:MULTISPECIES: alpha-glucuronidase family glycosyl hydrolase [Bacteroides]|jgi:alpha-glucuronidase|uniref:alpha-glucuronidase family glycosyl hydrolase n=1 Tax=Bacteroides TaxID=816 RepID=UPI00189D7167|nr:alpha-glucuronidase family glycosyl hydrolase [Bacteroides nordii]MBD9111851.1 alpha-glucuronidase [Bacteroides nordii]MCE8464228.1 alpha-glucuronidase [Bacteroides nordii]UYU49674.1 alpha-glucuronidase [Bacteroides nordii]
MKLKLVYIAALILCMPMLHAENGYDLWLRYQKVDNSQLLNSYSKTLAKLNFPVNSATLTEAKKELQQGLNGLLDTNLPETDGISKGTLLVGTPASSKVLSGIHAITNEISGLGDEGFLIKTLKVNGTPYTVIAARKDMGVMYGVFHFLRLLQTQSDIKELNITQVPKLQRRMLNHWDNLNGTIERGYAGYTLWDWQRLPGYIDPRYRDYARANASIGINGTVLNNVNANARSLTTEYLIKAAALADVFRPYGIRVYLTARFSAPKELRALNTADPLDPEVRQWWKDKVKEIYKYIPDFGGFLVKANSEGQPGPQDYKRTHADGANMMAEALEPYGGIVMWRAFVYENSRNVDRAGNGYEEFKPLDGKFNKNVFVQPKNGPIDFQPREPFHPLFGAMPQTPLMLEFQITQEYLGYATNLAYLGPLFEECLDADTYTKGKGTTVANVLEDYNRSHGISGIAGVANIGTDINWCGHLFGQSNWYAFGRMAWNPELSSEEVADEWLRMTFNNNTSFVNPIKEMMQQSRETVVNYRNPLGLNHIMNFATHYGPGPWYKDPHWDAKDYHKADETGIGVDRTSKGSNVVNQYAKPLAEILENLNTCPQKDLLWFHHLPWDYKMPSGKILWDELVAYYYKGVDEVRGMRKLWNSMEGKIDAERFNHVKQLLKVQEDEAIWWRDGCVLYFQTFSKRPIPSQYEHPQHTLEYYKRIPFPYNWEGKYE